MKKLIIPRNSYQALLLETLNGEVTEISSMRTLIDYIYIAPEDCEVVCNDISIDAKKGDLVLKLYGGNGTPGIIVTRLDELVAYSDEYQKEQESHKLKECGEVCNDCCTSKSID